MASPFGKNQEHKGTFRAEDLKMTFAGGSGDGALVQQANFTVNRTVNFMYEIGSNNIYYVGNRRQGQAQLVRVVGGSGTFKTMVTKYGDMCNPADLVLEGNGGCGGVTVNVSYTLKKATLTSIGASVTAQEIVINENLGFICSDIEYT
jgi:hypothetical protein